MILKFSQANKILHNIADDNSNLNKKDDEVLKCTLQCGLLTNVYNNLLNGSLVTSVVGHCTFDAHRSHLHLSVRVKTECPHPTPCDRSSWGHTCKLALLLWHNNCSWSPFGTVTSALSWRWNLRLLLNVSALRISRNFCSEFCKV